MTHFWKNVQTISHIAVIATCVSATTACTQQETQSEAQPKPTTNVPDILKSNKQDAFSLAVGTCFNDIKKLTGKAVVKKLAVISCDKPHDNEIYYGYELTMDSYPSNKDDIVTTCGSEFEKFVGQAYETSQYDYDVMMPTRSSWKDGDRRVLCLLYDGDYNKLSRSVEKTRVIKTEAIKTGKIDDES